MILLIYCASEEGPQTYWKVDATDADLEAVHAAMAGDPAAPFRFTGRTAPSYKDHEYVIRGGAIRTVDADRG